MFNYSYQKMFNKLQISIKSLIKRKCSVDINDKVKYHIFLRIKLVKLVVIVL